MQKLSGKCGKRIPGRYVWQQITLTDQSTAGTVLVLISRTSIMPKHSF